MSTLLDEVIERHLDGGLLFEDSILVKGKYYIAKPLEMKTLASFLQRFIDAYLVLIGKSKTYHFKEDTL
jgi:hypothetical protein